MRDAIVAAGVWSAVVLWFLVFDPGYQPSVLLHCGAFIGRSAACEAGQDAMNEAWQWLHIWPLLIACASGYVAIAIIRLRGRSRRQSSRPGVVAT